MCVYCANTMTLHLDGNRWECAGCGWVIVYPLHGFRTVEP